MNTLTDPVGCTGMTWKTYRPSGRQAFCLWQSALLFVAIGPSVWLAHVLMYGFVAARLAHFWAYTTKQSHEIRATFYTVGSLIVIYMACHVLWVAIT